jgi:hypothetical protein
MILTLFRKKLLSSCQIDTYGRWDGFTPAVPLQSFELRETAR